MSKPTQQSTEELWAAVFGAGTVLGLLILISFTAIAGWAWVAKFLESSAPAWIQAIGSIAAIVAALIIVQRQHSLDIQRRQSEERSAQLRKVRTLKVIFFSAARTCESVARSIGREHAHWPLEAAQIQEARARLLSIDPLQIPTERLALIIEECVLRLQSCAEVTAALKTPRPKHIEEVVHKALLAAAQECWLGLYETGATEKKLIAGQDIEHEEGEFGDFEESRKNLEKIRASLENNVGQSTTFSNL